MLVRSNLMPLWENVLMLVDFASWLRALSCKWQYALWGGGLSVICVCVYILAVSVKYSWVIVLRAL
jgi:hypothetical protein